MDPREHSHLLLLVEAIQAAPAKAGQLLRIAGSEGSESYREAVGRLEAALRDPERLQQVAAEVRGMLL